MTAFTPLIAEEKRTYFVGSIGYGQMADIDIAASLNLIPVKAIGKTQIPILDNLLSKLIYDQKILNDLHP